MLRDFHFVNIFCYKQIGLWFCSPCCVHRCGIPEAEPKQTPKKRIWKPQCFGLYQTTLFAQLRGVPTSIQELERVVLGIAASVDEKGDVESKRTEPWNEIEFQNLLYQRHCCDQTQRRQLSKTIRKFLRARMREKRNHCTSKMLQEFRNLGNMVTIHFEPLRPHKKTVDENFYVTSG